MVKSPYRVPEIGTGLETEIFQGLPGASDTKVPLARNSEPSFSVFLGRRASSTLS
jgi:hypothetical protein